MAPVILAACRAEPPPAVPVSDGESLVAAGRTVFVNNCARCHGARGQGAFGPTLVGDGVLDKYENAQALFDMVSVAMPYDAPGTLSREQYLQVISFLITENQYTAPKEIEPDRLADISLSR
ncbi:MAG: c-type cytochrome [Dehalococcoidales bacterium]|nr:c-type cytochrome [Dehalococcoidales bacterium]